MSSDKVAARENHCYVRPTSGSSVRQMIVSVVIHQIAGLSNLSSDISLAVDKRIGQLVDVPNVNVTAVLPLNIFVGSD